MTTREITVTRRAPAAPESRRVPPAGRALHAIKVKIDNAQSVWMGSDSRVEAMLPPGQVWIDSLLAKGSLPTVTITPGFKTGSARISGAGYAILDDQDAFGHWLAEKHVNGQELTNRTIEQYSFGPDDDFAASPDTYRQYTFQIKSLSRTVKGVYRIRCEDIQRSLDKDILLERTERLYSTIGATDGLIPLTISLDDDLAGHDYRVQHAPDYDQDPNELIAYAWLKSGDKQEIYSYTDIVTTAINGQSVRAHDVKQRGLFGTTAQEWTVADDEEDSNKQEIVHYPYYEAEPLALYQGIATGRFPDTRQLADGDHAGMDRAYLDVQSFAAASSDKRRVLRGITNVNAKKFLEEEILRFQPGVVVPDKYGRLSYRPKAVYGETTYLDTVDETNCYLKSVGDYVLDTSLIKAITSIKWDYNPIVGEFLKEAQWSDPAAVAAHNATDTEYYESKLISSARATEPEINRFAGVMYDRHGNVTPRLSLDVMPSLWWVPVGSPVRVKLRVKDHVNGSGETKDIDRVMTVVGSTHNQSKSKMSWQLAGEIERSTDIFTNRDPLSEEAYLEGASLLSNAPGIIVRADGHFGGTPVLVKGQKYAHIGPVTLDADFAPVWLGLGSGFELWARGVLLIAATIDLTGEGRSGGAPGEAGSLNLFDPVPGGAFDCHDRWVYGKISGSDSDDSAVYGAIRINRREITSTPPADYGSAPKKSVRLSLSANDDRLQGLYDDLSGSGGHGGGKSYSRGYLGNGGVFNIGRAVKYTEADGGAGANGGGDCTFVSFPGSDFIGSGKLITSGADATPPETWTPRDAATAQSLVRASGSPGMPGGFQWAIDGAGTKPTITSGNFVANVGSVTLYGTRIPSTPYTDGDGEHVLFHSRILPSSDQALWLSAHDVQHIPASAVVQESTLTGIDLAFENQRDNKIVLKPNTGADPSDGNPGDMTVHVDELADTNNLSPASARVMDNNYTWQPFEWVVDPRHTAYLNLLQSNRLNGGLEYFNQEERPVSFTPGSLWRQPSSRITWTLERFGPPDTLAYVDDAQVSDNRFVDPEFTDLLIGGDAWVIRSDIYELPTFALTAATVALSATIVGVEVSGGASLGTEQSSTLPAIPAMSVLVYSSTSTEVVFNTPADMSEIDNFEIQRDGVEVASIDVAGPFSYLDNALTASTRYTYRVRARNTSDVGPWSQEFSVTTDPATSSTNDLNPVTNLTHQVYSPTAIELFWSPPQDAGAATGYEIYRDGSLIESITGISTSSHFDSGLMPGTSYLYAVRVVNSTDRSDDVSTTVTTNS